MQRIGQKLLRSLSASSWVSTSSLRLELAARRCWSQFDTVHLLWADRDWCVIDRLLPADKRLVGTFHACDDDFPGVISGRHRLKRFDAVILMSESQKQNFVDAGVEPARIHVIHHGIDTDHFRPAQTTTEGSFRLLHVGSYRRDFEVLFEVCSALKDEDDIQIQLLTSPSIAHRFKALPNVEILPRLTDEELLAAYQSSDCLLMTATGATANNAILEAMACGLPVVSQLVGGIPEYVPSDCGVLCPPGDATALIRSIRELAREPETVAAMGRAARKHALSLNWKLVAAATQNVYDSLSVG
ncbi:MAG: glycosyltransferase family 4 protein [Planctomycetaceae bacterium]|nr:glycosyltransferase family 4 protein [Planctomycetaceae bacterium]